jgi:hypothetical protein
VAVVWVNAPPTAIESEPERIAGIVLTRRDAPAERTYFDDQDAVQSEDFNSPDSAAPFGVDEALPSAALRPRLEVSLAPPSANESLAPASQPLAEVIISAKGRAALSSRQGEDAIIAADLAAQRGRRGPIGPPTQVSIFGSAPAAGHSFVFVLDRSQSMGEAGLGVLRAAEGELAQALTALQANHKFQIIAYNKTPLALHPRGLAAADQENKERAMVFVKDLVAMGGTGHAAAVHAALRLNPDVIFLLTDGGDPRLTHPEMEEIAHRAGRTRITCLQFGFGPSPDEAAEAMRILAERTRGSYGYIDMASRR